MNEIKITYGIGRGDTSVAAYHSALRNAGIAEFNFEGERVIIPKNSKVRLLRAHERPLLNQMGETGDLVHLAIAKSFGSEKGREYFAGLGWVQDEEGAGFFVRYPGIDPVSMYSKESVEGLIDKGIESIEEVDKKREWGEIEKIVISKKCEGTPVSVVVAAVYKTAKF